MHLQLSGGSGAKWMMLAAVTEFDSILRQRFRKEVVRVGKYIKDSQEINITRDVIKNWVVQFHRMKDNGVVVKIPSTHAGAGNPDMIRGEVEDLFVDGDSLVMTCVMIGDDGIKAASRNDVSLGVPEEVFVDGNGHRYDQPIQHIALCPDPVVPGLGEFIPIAASINARKESTMDFAKVGKAFGISDTLTDKNAETLLLSHAGMAADIDKKLMDVESELKSLQDAKKEEDIELSHKKKVDPDLVKLMCKDRNRDLDDLVKDAHITPACCTKLKAVFGTTERITLSLSDSSGGKVFDQVVSALNDNDPVVLREHTGPQSTAELSRTDSGTGKSALVVDAERRAKEAAARA